LVDFELLFSDINHHQAGLKFALVPGVLFSLKLERIVNESILLSNTIRNAQLVRVVGAGRR
jgi:hypothetical protein